MKVLANSSLISLFHTAFLSISKENLATNQLSLESIPSEIISLILVALIYQLIQINFTLSKKFTEKGFSLANFRFSKFHV